MNPRQIAQLVGDEITKRLLRLDTKTFQRGIVSATAGNRATVAIEGAAGTIPNILCMTGYSPKIDDKVLVLSIGSSRSNFLIVGRLDEDGIVPPVANEVPSGTVNGSNTVFTLSADYIPGTLAVYLNGMRQKITDDYTETAGHTITFVGAPLSGDKILVDYLRLTGSVTPNESEYGFEWGVTPSESPNGSISVFTVNTYIGGSMQVTVDGIFQRRGIDFTEQPSAGTITFITDLPATGQSVRCSYQRVFVSMGGADMVDGFHANSTPQANKILPLDSNAKFPLSVVSNIGLPKILKVDFNNGTGVRSTTNLAAGMTAVPGATGDTSYTAPADVDVDILFTMTHMVNPNGGIAQLWLRINGANYGPGTYQESTTGWTVQTITYKYQLNAGQTITIGSSWQISGGTLTITNASGDALFPNEITGLVIPRST